jgi:hypothetical protein
MNYVTGFINCKVYGNVGNNRHFEAFLVVNGKIASTGSNIEISEQTKSLKGETVDLGGKIVLPGFIDSHLHIDELGMYINSLNLRNTANIEDLRDKLNDFASKASTSWILGHGWDQELFREKRWPTKDDLDAVEKERPIMLSRVCLHAAVLNSKALEMTGITSPTGIVVESEFQRAREIFKDSLSISECKKILKDALLYASKLGLTCLGFVSCDAKMLSALMSLWHDGEITTRVRVYLEPGKRCQTGEKMYENTDILSALDKLGIKRCFGDDMLRIQGIKILADGSLGAHTAWLTKPYSDMADLQGFPNIGKEELLQLVKSADAADLQIAVHGIGDATIDMILDTFQEAKIYDRGHRIEHLSVLRPDQIKRMKDIGLYASIQPHFVITDWWAIDRLGSDRAEFIHPFKSIFSYGIPTAFGTDSPVEELNPWETIYAAVTRGKYEDIPLAAATPNEALDITDAIYCYTAGGGNIMLDPDIGNLGIGKPADFIVLDKDPFETDPRYIKDIRVQKTYIGGKEVR